MSRRLPLLLGVCGAAIAAAAFTPAHAVPIATGSILNIVGAAGFTSTQINFSNPAAVLFPGSGSFAAFGTCTNCVTMSTPLTYNPFTAGVIYTATNNGLTTSFDITSSISKSTTVSGGFTLLQIVDGGTATLTGYDPTPGQWTITLNEQTGTVNGSFSATTLAVPEPASLTLLGVGLVGLGMTRLRRRRRDLTSA